MNVQSAIRAIQDLDGSKIFTHLPPLIGIFKNLLILFIKYNFFFANFIFIIVKYAESDTQKAKRQTQVQQIPQIPQISQFPPPLQHPHYVVTNTITNYTTNNYTITTTTTTTTTMNDNSNSNNNNFNNNNIAINPYIYYPNAHNMVFIFLFFKFLSFFRIFRILNFRFFVFVFLLPYLSIYYFINYLF